jgi:hypothetical protein
MTEITGEFQVTAWEEGASYHDAQATRATVRKTFSGDIEGTSVAELLAAGAEGGRGYVASEFFTGTIQGRKGTLIFQHGGLDDGIAPYTFGNIVPNSGTGELADMRGTITFRHDESGAIATLTIA